MRTSLGTWLLVLGAAIVLIAGLALRGSIGESGTLAVHALPEAEAERLMVKVAEVADTGGLVSQEVARSAARDYWGEEPSTPRAYLQVLTDEASARTGLTPDRPLWILSYDVSDETPDGRPLRHAYVFVDAQSGDFISTTFLP